MGVRFLIGRAGTGKSAACAAEIRELSRADPLGGALLWITPEQATFTAERMLLTGGKMGEGHGSFRAQVLSFRRLALLIGRQVGLANGAGRAGKGASPMEALARILLLQEIVARRKKELSIFAPVADRPGFVEKLDATLRELRQHGQTGDSLRASMAGDPGGVDTVTARKVADLALLLDAWSAEVEKGETWDLERLMQAAAKDAEKAAIVTGGGGGGGARVWVDGFSALSALEMQMVVALGRHAAGVTITLEADPASAALKEMRGAAAEEAGVFARTERLHRRLVDALRAGKVEIEGTEYLREGLRFRAAGIRRVEAGLFGEGAVLPKISKDGVAGGGAQWPAPPEAAGVGRRAGDGGGGGGVELWECSDPETEVRVAAQGIREMVLRAKEPLRYREIGVIVPDLEGYEDAIGRIFTEHGIPHFIDQRRSIAHHPLVELLRSAVAISVERWEQDEVLLYLKTGLAGVSQADVAAVENYVLAHGIDHVAWSEPWRWVEPNRRDDEEGEIPRHKRELLDRVNGVRARVWRDLAGWMAVAEKPAASAAEYVRGLVDLLATLKVETQLEAWARAARTSAVPGDVELAQVHEQAWRQVQELLGMLEQLLSGRSRTLAEFAELLSTALEGLTLGLIPPTVDQVLVSSVTRSRVPELKAAFLLGAVEGAFPKVVPEDPILSDQQRELINGRTADRIGEGSDRQLVEMPFFDYTALTRAGDRLIVTYPLADRQGRAVSPSRYVSRIVDLFAGTSGELTQRKFDAESRTAVERIGTLDDLLSGVASWARNVIRRRRETLEGFAAEKSAALAESEMPLAALYNWLVSAPDQITRGAVGLVWGGVAERIAPHLAGELARRFYPPAKSLRLSVSQLEKFAGCPLQYFMHYTLGLRPRAVLELDTMHLGILYHRILERVYGRVIDGEISWPECDVRSLRRALEEEVDRVCASLHEELAAQTPAYDQMRARTKRTLGIVLEGQRRRACAGDFRPVDVEVNFGSERKEEMAKPRAFSLPVLRIKTGGGRTVELNGKIDRVDAVGEGGRRMVDVVDYKSSSKKTLDMYLVYYGLALQLPVYAVVMRELAKQSPMAALYVPLGISRQTVERPPVDSPAPGPEADAFYRKSQPRGVVDEAGAAHLDHAVAPHEDAGGKSAWYAIGYKKDGGLLKGGDMIGHGDFGMMLDYVQWKIGVMADGLMAGEIAPAPYRDQRRIPCDECDFASLCPFDKVSGHFRAVPKMKRDEALGAMRAAMGGGSAGRGVIHE